MKKLLRPAGPLLGVRLPRVPAALKRAAAKRGLVVSPGMDRSKLDAKGGKGTLNSV